MCVYLCQVYDGDNMNFPLVGAFCGVSIPAYFVSSGNFLTIHFVTDSSVQRRGFNATYRAIPCKIVSSFLNAMHYTENWHNLHLKAVKCNTLASYWARTLNDSQHGTLWHSKYNTKDFPVHLTREFEDHRPGTQTTSFKTKAVLSFSSSYNVW